MTSKVQTDIAICCNFRSGSFQLRAECYTVCLRSISPRQSWDLSLCGEFVTACVLGFRISICRVDGRHTLNLVTGSFHIHCFAA